MSALTRPARIGSLFSGYGGLDRGVAAVIDAEPVWFAEFDSAPSKILATHFPALPNYGDVTKIDWATVTPIEILTGGFPCQDVSLAGARAGIKDGTRSGLWSEYFRAIVALQPRLVVIENVRGLLSAKAGDHTEIGDWTDEEISDMESGQAGMGEPGGGDRPILNAFGSVLGDLALIGFDAEWIGIPASAVGAPHQRYRVFIIAYPATENPHGTAGDKWWKPATRKAETRGSRADTGGSDRARATDAVVFPTPVASDADRSSTTYAGGNPTLAGAASVLPTPVTSNSHGNQKNSRGELLLPGVVESLPVAEPDLLGTPRATAAAVSAVAIETEELKGRIEAQVAMLPTPITTDAKQMGPADLERDTVQLRAAVTLFPTVTTQESHSGPSQENRNTPPLNAVVPLLPTIVASEGTKATTRQGIDQKGATGQVWLTNVAHDIARPESSNPTVAEYEALWASLDDQSAFWRTAKANYWPAVSRWAQVMGRPAPAPTIPDGKEGRFRLNPEFTEWMMGQPRGWITGCGLTRNEQLKACGNGVVWQQAAAALAILLPRTEWMPRS